MKVVLPKDLPSCLTPTRTHVSYMCFSSVRCFTKEKEPGPSGKSNKRKRAGIWGRAGKPHTTAHHHGVWFLSEALLPLCPVIRSEHSMVRLPQIKSGCAGEELVGTQRRVWDPPGHSTWARGRPGSMVQPRQWVKRTGTPTPITLEREGKF